MFWRTAVLSSYGSSCHISLALKVKQWEMLAQRCSIIFQKTSILPCVLFTNLSGMSLSRMDDFMAKLFIYLWAQILNLKCLTADVATHQQSNTEVRKINKRRNATVPGHISTTTLCMLASAEASSDWKSVTGMRKLCKWTGPSWPFLSNSDLIFFI
jgi:hypothetical protein